MMGSPGQPQGVDNATEVIPCREAHTEAPEGGRKSDTLGAFESWVCNGLASKSLLKIQCILELLRFLRILCCPTIL